MEKSVESLFLIAGLHSAKEFSAARTLTLYYSDHFLCVWVCLQKPHYAGPWKSFKKFILKYIFDAWHKECWIKNAWNMWLCMRREAMINPCLISTHSRLSNSNNELYATTRQIQRYGLVLILKNKYSSFFCSIALWEDPDFFSSQGNCGNKRQYAKAGYEINESISDTHIGKYLYPVSLWVLSHKITHFRFACVAAAAGSSRD